MMDRNQGPIEILCDELGVKFTGDMERINVLTAFVKELLNEIDGMARSDKAISHLTGVEVSDEVGRAIKAVKIMLTYSDRAKLIEVAGEAHSLTHQPDEGPCDHYLDMLSSCISAIRFGLEQPCRSRHAAEAANHVWTRKYGITLFDKHSNGWGKSWARVKLTDALGGASEPQTR